jgi:hypothetical protein
LSVIAKEGALYPTEAIFTPKKEFSAQKTIQVKEDCFTPLGFAMT